jgi:hypothetical protein
MALGMKPQASSAQRQPVTGRTGKQAGRLVGMQAVGGSSSESSPDDGTFPISLRTDQANRFLGKYAACYLCKQADMQTVIRAGRQTAAIAVTP